MKYQAMRKEVSDQYVELDKVESEDEVSNDEKVLDQHEDLDKVESEDAISNDEKVLGQHDELDIVKSEDEVSNDEKVSDQHEELVKVEYEEKVPDQHEELDKIATDNLDGPVEIYVRETLSAGKSETDDHGPDLTSTGGVLINEPTKSTFFPDLLSVHFVSVLLPLSPEIKSTGNRDRLIAGKAWLQNSNTSWKELLRDATSNSFSISQILPGLSLPKPELPVMGKTGTAHKSNSTDKSNSQDFSVEEQNNVHFSKKLPVLDDYQKKETMKNEGSAPTPEKKHVSALKQVLVGDTNYNETCSFMRSAA
ncbi:hypothetical protein MTR67_019827 [Solanum verrucosum]|uniref:Uncharacterized protein n=1 Tax=Solanum verrucosum TaxID=315347 RepID=A0AAF0QM72_SOLVR|nr:hypothetical protein MTR67_019827 [Solanum verrucosum]